jgi:hypothetical protein
VAFGFGHRLFNVNTANLQHVLRTKSLFGLRSRPDPTRNSCLIDMRGLGRAMHVFAAASRKHVDADLRRHDGVGITELPWKLHAAGHERRRPATEIIERARVSRFTCTTGSLRYSTEWYREVPWIEFRLC